MSDTQEKSPEIVVLIKCKHRSKWEVWPLTCQQFHHDGDWQTIRVDTRAVIADTDSEIAAELERVECPTANFRMTPLSERVRRVVNELLNTRADENRVWDEAIKILDAQLAEIVHPGDFPRANELRMLRRQLEAARNAALDPTSQQI